jgi:hypothetical protein
MTEVVGAVPDSLKGPEVLLVVSLVALVLSALILGAFYRRR